MLKPIPNTIHQFTPSKSQNQSVFNQRSEFNSSNTLSQFIRKKTCFFSYIFSHIKVDQLRFKLAFSSAPRRARGSPKMANCSEPPRGRSRSRPLGWGKPPFNPRVPPLTPCVEFSFHGITQLGMRTSALIQHVSWVSGVFSHVFE